MQTVGLFGDEFDHVRVSAQGLRLAGAASVFDDLMVPGQSVRVGATAPDFEAGFVGDSSLFTFNFDGVNLAEEVHFAVQMPHRWKQGSTIYPHVHLAPTSTNSDDATERNVRFSLEYTWAQIRAPFTASAVHHMDCAFVPATSQWRHLLATNSAGIDATSKGLSSMLVCRLYRDPAATEDTYPQDVAFLQFDVHFEIDGLGSEGEYSKL